VCGMTVDPAHAAGHASYAGQEQALCSTGCAQRFTADYDGAPEGVGQHHHY